MKYLFFVQNSYFRDGLLNSEFIKRFFWAAHKISKNCFNLIGEALGLFLALLFKTYKTVIELVLKFNLYFSVFIFCKILSCIFTLIWCYAFLICVIFISMHAFFLHLCTNSSDLEKQNKQGIIFAVPLAVLSFIYILDLQYPSSFSSTCK